MATFMGILAFLAFLVIAGWCCIKYDKYEEARTADAGAKTKVIEKKPPAPRLVPPQNQQVPAARPSTVPDPPIRSEPAAHRPAKPSAQGDGNPVSPVNDDYHRTSDGWNVVNGGGSHHHGSGSHSSGRSSHGNSHHHGSSSHHDNNSSSHDSSSYNSGSYDGY